MKTFIQSLFTISILLSPAFAVEETAALKKLSASRRIDQIVEAGYQTNQITPNPIASDEVFVRRIYLDVIGRIPTHKETLAFLNSKNKNKKAKLIDKLLDSDGYVSHFYNYWADILRAKTRINGNNQGTPAGYAFERWIKKSLRENKPYDQFVREMVSATGSTWENGAVGYYIRDYQMPLDNLAITSQVFLGTEIVCAQCHNHPFDKWTQMDYYQLAAFTYGKITSNQSPNQKQALEMFYKRKPEISKAEKSDIRKAFSEILKPVRFNNVYDGNRRLRLPHDYQYEDAKPKSPVKPTTLFGNKAILSDAEHPSATLADWITSRQNERFTTVIANRLWKKAFGVALIEPVDAITDQSTPSNPELMVFLEKRMRAFDYDMKKFLRMVYRTKTYQRETSRETWTPGLAWHYPGPILRRMSAEQIWDSLVAMAIENPDAPDPRHELAVKRRLTEVQLIAESIYDQRPAEFLKNAHEISGVQKQLSAEIEAAQQIVGEARESKDPQKIREALKEANRIRRQLATKVEELVFREGLEKKIQLVAMNGSNGNANEFLNDLATLVAKEDSNDVANGMDSLIGENDGIVKQLVNALVKADLDAIRKADDKKEELQREKWSVKTKSERASYKNFTKIANRTARASEIDSPAPPGHFLREFGQSDRELVQNANDQASITQALAMLNGPVTSSITNRYSVLVRDMSGENFKERLNTIFLTMLSRKPRPDEMKIFAQAWKENPESGTVSGIVWTILNMRQFLFIE